MANPNSLLTRLRRRLAKRIAPGPDPGESWCVGCSLHGGRTVVLTADGGPDHAREHQESSDPGAHVITLQSAWPPHRD